MYRVLFVLTLGLFIAATPAASFAQSEDTPVPGAGAVYCPQLSHTMVRGARDRTTVPPGQVTELQKFISDYYDIDPDDIVTGYFGALTHRNTVRFQREQGLPAFGIVGPLTRAAIARVCGNTTGTPTPIETCIFNGQTIADGASITAYASSTETYGGRCKSETRTCIKGVLIGSYQASSCSVSNPNTAENNNCSFNGQAVANGASIVAYQATSVPVGGACVSERRYCIFGFLTGSYAHATCAPQPESMSLLPEVSFSANPAIIAPGKRTTLSWVSTSATWCSAGGGWNGTKATSGTEETAILWQTTTFNLTCFGPGGLTPVTKSVAVAVIPEERPQKRSCIQDGITLEHGTSRIFYSTRTVNSVGSCTAVSELRACNDGTLSGSFPYASCAPNPTVGESPFYGCTFNGQTIADGASIAAYASSAVPAGGQCMSETRTCFKGVLTGSYGYATCAVGTTPPTGPLTDANCEPLLESGVFFIRPTTGPAPLPVTFSFGGGSGYAWSGFDFGDGTKLDAAWDSPLVRIVPQGRCTRHTYAAPGIYTIKQTLYGVPLTCGSQTCKTVTVY